MVDDSLFGNSQKLNGKSPIFNGPFSTAVPGGRHLGPAALGTAAGAHTALDQPGAGRGAGNLQMDGLFHGKSHENG